MNSIQRALTYLQKNAGIPKPWGVYHGFCIGVLLAVLALLFFARKSLRARPALVRKLTNVLGIVVLIAELSKQILLSFHIGEGGAYWEYPWHIFPLQVCSTPLYVCLFLLFLPEGGFRRALCCYLGTYAMFGGIVVMLAPSSVFCDSVFLNIHTMLWHIDLTALGFLLWCGGAVGRRFSAFAGATGVFLFFISVAVTLNAALVQLAPYGFNLFYVSPYIPHTASQITAWFWNAVPYPVYLFVYVSGFVFIALAIFLTLRPLSGAKRENGCKR